MSTDCLSRRMRVPAAIEWLCSRHGGDKARRIVRLEQQKARRARSRKRFNYWAAVAAELDCESRNPMTRGGSASAAVVGILYREGALLDQKKEG